MSSEERHAHTEAGHDAAHAKKGAHGKGPSAQHGAGHGEHAGHEAHKKHEHHEHAAHGPPPWLISFGDMMTLFLCFFIILVTMAKEQNAGLMAKGLGPFVAGLQNLGMDSALTGSERLQAVNTYRERFGLPALTDPEQLVASMEFRSAAEIEKIVSSSLRPYTELKQPLVATFTEDSAELRDQARRYLDLLAETLRPGYGQMLILEGHADDAAGTFAFQNTRLAAARSQAVKAFLVENHGFIPQRVEARAYAIDFQNQKARVQGVDARLIQPAPKVEG